MEIKRNFKSLLFIAVFLFVFSIIAIANSTSANINNPYSYALVTINYANNYDSGKGNTPDMSYDIFLGDLEVPYGNRIAMIPLTDSNGNYIIDNKKNSYKVPGIHINREKDLDGNYHLQITSYGNNNEKSREVVDFDVKFLNAAIRKVINPSENPRYAKPYKNGCGIDYDNTANTELENDEIESEGLNKLNFCSVTSTGSDQIKIEYSRVQIYSCILDSECNDNDKYTLDKCIMEETSSNCFYETIECFENSDCDDNNPNTEDYCSNPGKTYSECTHETISSAICGNHIIEGEEVCDDGNFFNGLYGFCNSNCTALGPHCGDKEIFPSIEQCDDGNTENGDGCSSACKLEATHTPSCTDTDSNLNADKIFFIKGSVTAIDEFGNSRTETDSCVNDNLIEWACNQEKISSQYISCENGCFDGACITSEEKNICIDSDNGKTLGIKGFAKTLNSKGTQTNFIEDTCSSDGTRVFEAYCSSDIKISIWNMICEFGCSNGACLTELPPIPECGNNIYEPANNEECDDGNLVNGDGCSSICKLEKTNTSYTCEDSDNGKNLGIKGKVIVKNSLGIPIQTIQDSCSEDGTRVYEAYCGEDNLYRNWNMICEFGCSNGACLTELPPIPECGNNIYEPANNEECDGTTNCFECQCASGYAAAGDGTCEKITKNDDDDDDDDECVPSWSCSDWSDCQNGYKTRFCTDSKDCGKWYNKPVEAATCSDFNSYISGQTIIDLGANSRTSTGFFKSLFSSGIFFWIFWIIIILLIIWLIWLLIVWILKLIFG